MIAALVLVSGPVTASAQGCFSCDEVVQLTDPAAKCFLSGYDEFDRNLAKSDNGRVNVDLSACLGVDGAGSRGVESLNTPDPKAVLDRSRASRKATRSAYLLDKAGLECVKQVLGAKKGPYDPDIVIDLATDCSP